MSNDRAIRCDQCGGMAPLNDYPPYGRLCDRCSYRQNEYEENADSFAHLSASNFGFLSESE